MPRLSTSLRRGHLSRSRRRVARPGYSFSFVSGSQQLVHTTDKLVRIFQRAALGQQRLIQQQFHPFAELRVVLGIGRAFHQLMRRVQFEDVFTSGAAWPAAANSFAI